MNDPIAAAPSSVAISRGLRLLFEFEDDAGWLHPIQLKRGPMLIRPSQKSERGQRHVERAIERERARADVEAGAFDRDPPRLLKRVWIRLHEELRDPLVAIAHAALVDLERVAELDPAGVLLRDDQNVGAEAPDSALRSGLSAT